MNLVWFRSDLRTADNRALAAACSDPKASVMGLYCYTPKQWDRYGIGQNQRHAVLTAVADLSADLEELNIPLIVLEAESHSSVVTEISHLVQQLGINQLYFNIEYPIDERQRDRQLVEALEAEDVACHRYSDGTLVAPWQVVTQSGTGFKVYSSFYKAALNSISEGRDSVALDARPKKRAIAAQIPSQIATSTLPVVNPVSATPPPFRVSDAMSQLNEFTDQRVKYYDQQRDIPELDGTSSLSTALTIGTLSPRQCYQKVNDLTGKGAETWRKELFWRDFYRSVMWHFPHVCRDRGFLDVDQFIHWNDDPATIDAWKSGKTGVPIVDAAMHQLLATGWMHNRLRMIVASYLTKNLWVNWRVGEAFFAEHLFDYDFASNNGGWQWSASVGTDAAPYFRVFNPASQGAKFDPNAHFIRKWISQLSNYSAKQIHGFEQQKLGTYWTSLVDLKSSRKQAIEQFKQARLLAEANQ